MTKQPRPQEMTRNFVPFDLEKRDAYLRIAELKAENARLKAALDKYSEVLIERCAKVCERQGKERGECPEMPEYCAAAIRALSPKVERSDVQWQAENSRHELNAAVTEKPAQPDRGHEWMARNVNDFASHFLQRYEATGSLRESMMWAYMQTYQGVPADAVSAKQAANWPDREQPESAEPVAWMWDEAKYSETDVRGRCWSPMIGIRHPMNPQMTRNIVPLYTMKEPKK